MGGGAGGGWCGAVRGTWGFKGSWLQLGSHRARRLCFWTLQMSARLERERRSAKISKKVTFWIDVFSLEYCNCSSILALSLESRANPAFRFLGGLLGGSEHYFGALVGASGGVLGSLGSSLAALGASKGVSLGYLGFIWHPQGSYLVAQGCTGVVFGCTGLAFCRIGLVFVAQGSHLAAQGNHLVAQGSHSPASGLLWIASMLHDASATWGELRCPPMGASSLPRIASMLQGFTAICSEL